MKNGSRLKGENPWRVGKDHNRLGQIIELFGAKGNAKGLRRRKIDSQNNGMNEKRY